MGRSTILAFAGVVAVAAAASAHHSIAGMYDDAQRVTLEGVIARFHFVNPHPFLVIDIKDDGGTTRQWTAELDNRWELVEVGVTSETFKRGDRVVVTGSPGRAERERMYVRRLERPADGFLYQQISTRPSIGTIASPPRR